MEKIIWIFFIVFVAVVLSVPKPQTPKVSPIKTDTISLELNGDFFVSTILQEEPLIIYKKNDKGSYASLEIEKSKNVRPKKLQRQDDSRRGVDEINSPNMGEASNSAKNLKRKIHLLQKNKRNVCDDNRT